MTMKLFFEPWERRPSHDDRLTRVFFREFEDIVGEVLVIHKLASNARIEFSGTPARVRIDVAFSNTGRAAFSASPGPTLADDIHLRSSCSSALGSSEPRNSRSWGGSGASI